MKIVIICGSGSIGKKLVKSLRERGHEAVAASPSSGVNAVTGEGLSEVPKPNILQLLSFMKLNSTHIPHMTTPVTKRAYSSMNILHL